MTNPIRLSTLAFIAFTASLGAQTRPSRDVFVRTVDSLVNAALKDGPVAGFGIAVVKGRDTLVMKGYGYADLENDLPVTPQTIFRIGSVTKQFTSAAVMQLVEQGKVSLDDDITKYLPALNTRGKRVLIRHLLNHTSGIPSYTDIGPSFGARLTLDLPHDSLLAMVANLNSMFDPGTAFYYNNTGYYVLGMLIEKVGGKPTYGDYMAEQLFRPMGLSGTMYCGTRPLIKRRAQGYERGPRGLQNAGYMSMNLPGAAGALCSTTGDLVAWTRALHAGTVVKPASFAQMTTPVTFASGRPMSYGFGIGRDTIAGARTRISHGGGINGFISELAHYPGDTLTIVVLSNTSPAPSSQLATDISRAWYGIPLRTPPPPPKDLPLTAADRTRYAGTYSVIWPDGVRRRARIYEEGERLVITAEAPGGQPMNAAQIRWQGGNEFLSPLGRIQFDVSGSSATGFYVARGARPLEGRKVP